MLFFLISPARPARAEDLSTRIYPFPQAPTLNSTLSFTLEIRIKYIYKMTSYQVYVSWNPALLNVTTVTKGTFLSSNSQIPTTVYQNLNRATGLLRYGETHQTPTIDTAVGGNGTLFTLTMVAVGTGQCAIDLHDTVILLLTSQLGHVVDDGYFNNQQVAYSDGGVYYNSTIYTNSTVYSSSFNLTEKTLAFNVSGPTGTAGYINVTIPRVLMDVDTGQPPGVWVVILDGVPRTDFDAKSNATHTFLYLNYTHSDHSVVISGNKVIPELSPGPYLLILLLATITLLPLLLQRRKNQQIHRIHQA
jgi:hypothetical protein